MKKTEPTEQDERPKTKDQGPKGDHPSSFIHRLSSLTWRFPLGWQLSALYILVFVITLSLVGSLVYSQQKSFLVKDVADRLEQQARTVVTRMSVPHSPEIDRSDVSARRDEPGEDGPARLPVQATDDAESHTTSDLIRLLSGPDVTVAVLDNQGKAMTSTIGLVGETAPAVDPVTPEQVAQALQGSKPVQWEVRRTDGSHQVVMLMPLTVALHSPGGSGASTGNQFDTLLVEQSASLAAVDAALTSLGTYLLLGVLGGALVGVVLILLLTRRALRPLEDVVDTAEAIASGDLERRLRLPAGRSEVARLGKAFDYMVSRLVATLEAQRRFIADASHELRTPLTSLKGLSEILVIGAHGNDQAVIEQSAGAMRGELDRLSRLVNDLLTLSRLSSAGDTTAPQVRRVRMNVCDTIEAVVEQMAKPAEERGVYLTHQCDGPLWVMGDAGQTKQVLLNLVDNALRYTPAGGKVTLRGSIEGHSARVEVQDTGSGIAEHDLPHIFQRFYRGDTSRSRATGSTGLGLAIVQGIIEAHGGIIDVQSTLGEGTCFTI